MTAAHAESLRQLVEDRTLRPCIAVAAVNKGFERPLHRGHFSHAPVQVGDMRQRDALHVGAGAPPVLPQLQQGRDLDHAETQFARVTNEAQRVHFIRAVLAIAGVGAANLRQQPQGFIVASHLGGHPGAQGRLADVERPCHRSRKRSWRGWRTPCSRLSQWCRTSHVVLPSGHWQRATVAIATSSITSPRGSPSRQCPSRPSRL